MCLNTKNLCLGIFGTERFRTESSEDCKMAIHVGWGITFAPFFAISFKRL